MRISTSMQYSNHLNYLQTANSRVDAASGRYNTGLKFQTAGENPAGMASKIKYESDIEAYKQYAINAGIVADSLSHSETALGQIWDSLGSIRTRLIQAVNGTLDDGSRAALAEDIKQTQAQIFDLMNTKNSEGEYIFSGANSSQPTFTMTTDGHYECQADGSAKYVIVSPTNKVQVTDSGLNIFENVQLAHTFSVDGNMPDFVTHVDVSDYDQFNDMFKEMFDYGENGQTGDNAFSLTFTDNSNFTLTLPDGTTKTGEIKDGVATVMGMSFTVDQDALNAEIAANGSATLNLQLDQPRQGNILNELSRTIDYLTTPQDEWDNHNPPLSNDIIVQELSRLQYSIDSAQKQVDSYRGLIGARSAHIDDIIKSDETLSDIKSEAKANISEVDAFTAVSDLVQAQAALSVAQQTYNMVHSSTLFNYI